MTQYKQMQLMLLRDQSQAQKLQSSAVWKILIKKEKILDLWNDSIGYFPETGDKSAHHKYMYVCAYY